MQDNKAKDFTNNQLWQEGHKLVLATYRFLRAFPADGSDSLKNQIKETAVMITSNIAKGLSLSDSSKRLLFFSLADASMIEFRNCLLIARDTGQLKPAYYDEIARQMVVVDRLLAAMKKIKSRSKSNIV